MEKCKQKIQTLKQLVIDQISVIKRQESYYVIMVNLDEGIRVKFQKKELFLKKVKLL